MMFSLEIFHKYGKKLDYKYTRLFSTYYLFKSFNIFN